MTRILVLICLLVPGVVEAIEPDWKHLEEVSELGVIVEKFDELPTSYTKVETAMELKLRQGGIPIDDDADVYVYVAIVGIKIRELGYVWHLNISIRDNLPNFERGTVATLLLWQIRSSLFTSPLATTKTRLLEEVDDAVDEIINGWQKAHQK